MQVVPIVAFWIFQQSLEFVEYVKRGMEPKKSARRKLAEAYGASVAQEFSKDSKSTTGVRFTDVAGVDHAVDVRAMFPITGVLSLMHMDLSIRLTKSLPHEVAIFLGRLVNRSFITGFI